MVSHSPGTREDGGLNSPDVSVVEPQSVPSRISVVLVEEAKSGALMGWSAHMWIRIYDCRLEWRSRPVGLFVRTVIDRQVLRRCCLLPTLPGSGFRLHLRECRSQPVMLTQLARVG